MNKLNIRRSSRANSTVFFTDDTNQLRTLLKELKLLAHSDVVKVNGVNGVFHRFKECLTDEQFKYMQDNFKVAKPKVNVKMVRGFKGNLVTGCEYEFKEL